MTIQDNECSTHAFNRMNQMRDKTSRSSGELMKYQWVPRLLINMGSEANNEWVPLHKLNEIQSISTITMGSEANNREMTWVPLPYKCGCVEISCRAPQQVPEAKTLGSSSKGSSGIIGSSGSCGALWHTNDRFPLQGN